MDYLFFIIMVCYIWFDTTAFIEYAALFNVKFSKYKEFEFERSINPSLDYHFFLMLKYNNFFVRLVTCPYCVLVWLNIIGVYFTEACDFGFNVIFSWIGYFGLKYLLKKFNE